MRTVYALRPDRQRAVATETMQVWCSLAERLGMFALKVGSAAQTPHLWTAALLLLSAVVFTMTSMLVRTSDGYSCGVRQTPVRPILQAASSCAPVLFEGSCLAIFHRVLVCASTRCPEAYHE